MTFSTSRPACLREVDAFGEALHQAGDADLVDHLGELAGAGRAHQADHAGIGVDDRLGAVRRSLRLAAAHHGQHAVFGAGLAAGDRRVDEAEALRLGGVVQFAGDIGAGGGVVDQDCARLHAGEARHRRRCVTERRSSSLPTQVKTKSASLAAAAGVGAGRRRAAHPASALAAVRL